MKRFSSIAIVCGLLSLSIRTPPSAFKLIFAFCQKLAKLSFYTCSNAYDRSFSVMLSLDIANRNVSGVVHRPNARLQLTGLLHYKADGPTP